jgi:GNAT superfamily N-acetyltransferase
MTFIVLRPAVPADTEFCCQLHKAAMGDYVAAIWGWDEQVQRDFHTRAFNSGRWQIITADVADIGVLDVEYRPGEIYLSRVEIHPDYQGRGIGTRLISALASEARQNGQDLVLDVLTVNHRAQALYRRLGQTETARQAGNIKITMPSARPRRTPVRRLATLQPGQVKHRESQVVVRLAPQFLVAPAQSRTNAAAAAAVTPGDLDAQLSPAEPVRSSQPGVD